MKTKSIILLFSAVSLITTLNSCSKTDNKNKSNSNESVDEFKYVTEQFADLRIIRYKTEGFENLTLQQKTLAYYLYQAALCGRDIIWDQNFKHNLTIRRTLEEIVKNYKGDRNSKEFNDFIVYTKRVWFSNGIHHHYSMDKFLPDFSKEYLKQIIIETEGDFPLLENEDKANLAERLIPIIFDPEIGSKRVSLDPNKDLIFSSACNLYENISQAEVEDYYKTKINPNDTTPISYGLNSKLVKKMEQ